MKKMIAVILVIAAMAMCLAGCGGKKATAVVTFESDNVTLLPTGGMKNIGVQIENNQIMTVNVKGDVVNTFPIMVDGAEYSCTVTNENGKITVTVDPELAFTVK